jgi:hypothetical protein
MNGRPRRKKPMQKIIFPQVGAACRIDPFEPAARLSRGDYAWQSCAVNVRVLRITGTTRSFVAEKKEDEKKCAQSRPDVGGRA